MRLIIQAGERIIDLGRFDAIRMVRCDAATALVADSIKYRAAEVVAVFPTPAPGEDDPTARLMGRLVDGLRKGAGFAILANTVEPTVEQIAALMPLVEPQAGKGDDKSDPPHGEPDGTLPGRVDLAVPLNSPDPNESAYRLVGACSAVMGKTLVDAAVHVNEASTAVLTFE